MKRFWVKGTILFFLVGWLAGCATDIEVERTRLPAVDDRAAPSDQR